jgi:hypothetical protein
VAAELGAVGVLLYLGFLAAAVLLLLAVVRRNRAVGLGLAVCFLVLFLHSLFYSGFFEDPLMWGVLGFAAAIVAVPAPETAASPRPADTGRLHRVARRLRGVTPAEDAR